MKQKDRLRLTIGDAMGNFTRIGKALLVAVIGLVLLVSLLLGSVIIRSNSEIANISDRLNSNSNIYVTSDKTIEFKSWGSGPPVLVLHGAGGGYDQGELLANAFGGDGFNWIAISRFGYLRSSLPKDFSTRAQAAALAELLDHLNIKQVSILAMSGGVPPALQFASRYPTKTSSLVLLSSAPFTPFSAADQSLPLPAWAYQSLFSSNVPLWVLGKIAPGKLEAIFDVSPELRSRLLPTEAIFVEQLVASFQPVTLRVAGLKNEGAAIDPAANYNLTAISAPTLIIHAKDDGINPFVIGQFAARQIAGAEFMTVLRGGHLLLGHHLNIRQRIRAFLQDTVEK